MRPLKVLYVINGLGTGGAERSLAEMLPGFEAAGVSMAIACFYRRGEGVEAHVLERGTDVQFVMGRRLPARVRSLRGYIRRMRPDLLHSTIAESTLAGGLAALGTGVPVLASLVSTPYADTRLQDPNIRPLRLWAARLVDGWSARHLVTHFHAITGAVKTEAVRALGVPADRITVVERGRDVGRLGTPSPERRARTRAALGLGDDHQVVLHVGRQEFAKGQRHLLEAAARLVAERSLLVVLMAGRPGHATAELRATWERLGLGDRVRFLGHRDDVPDLYAAADVFAFPSLWEGLGGSLIEAMALGLPIVASDIPAIREVVEDGRNALLAAPADSAALAQALGALLDDPARRAVLGARSQQIYQDRFTLARSVERMLDLYHRIAAHHTGGARATALPAES
jgi:glycosyltransferase involved in cell wall biosynthesis